MALAPAVSFADDPPAVTGAVVNDGTTSTVLDATNSTFAFSSGTSVDSQGSHEGVTLTATSTSSHLATDIIVNAPSGQLVAGQTYTSGGVSAELPGGVPACGGPDFTVDALTRGGDDQITSIAVSFHDLGVGIHGCDGELRWQSTLPYPAHAVAGQGDFGYQAVGAVSAPHTFTLTSVGSGPLTVGAVGLDGVWVDQLQIVSNGCTDGLVLSPGQSCAVQVAFAPTAAATLAGTTLDFTDSSGTDKYPLSGLGEGSVIGAWYSRDGQARELDTRTGLGGHTGPLGAGQVLTLQITDEAGHPAPITAVVLNLTVTNPTSPGYLTAYPHGATRPTASSINFPKGWTGANSVTVPTSADGKIDIWNFAGSVDVIGDVEGYYLADNTYQATGKAGGFHPLTDTVRVLDTRTAGHTAVPAGGTVTVPLSLGAQASAWMRAVAVNVTAVDAHGPGFLTAWSGRSGVTVAGSTVNYTAAGAVSNLAIVATDGTNITVRNTSASTVDVVLDAYGWYDDGTRPQGLHFQPLASPLRVVDSRIGLGVPGTLQPNSVSHITLPSRVTGKAIVMDVTGIQPSTPTFLHVWLQPLGSSSTGYGNLNLVPGDIRSNMVMTGLGTTWINVYNQSGTVDVVADVAGTFS